MKYFQKKKEKDGSGVWTPIKAFLYTVQLESYSKEILKRHLNEEWQKSQKSIISIMELSIAHFKCNRVVYLCFFIPWLSCSTVHRLCFLQIWGKWARGGRSIQARKSEWPMTVQNRRKLRKKIKHVIILLLNPDVHFLSLLCSPQKNMTAACSGSQDKGSNCLSWKNMIL